jgi:hypothetical protein
MPLQPTSGAATWAQGPYQGTRRSLLSGKSLCPLESALEKRHCSWERRAMSHGAKSVLEAFEALSTEEREEVLAELIRRAASRDYEQLQDEDLTAAADQIFVEYERSESEN